MKRLLDECIDRKLAREREFGLTDEQIAEALELPLEVVKQVNLEQ